jgi:hypothetical protein
MRRRRKEQSAKSKEQILFHKKSSLDLRYFITFSRKPQEDILFFDMHRPNMAKILMQIDFRSDN